MGKSSGGIRNAGKNPRKKLTSEQSKEFHNAAALGLFNSAVGKGDNLNRTVDGLEDGKTLQDVVNGIERQKKAKQRERQRIKKIKAIDYTGNKFAEEVAKTLIDFSNDMIKYYDKSINEKKRLLKKNKVKL